VVCVRRKKGRFIFADCAKISFLDTQKLIFADCAKFSFLFTQKLTNANVSLSDYLNHTTCLLASSLVNPRSQTNKHQKTFN